MRRRPPDHLARESNRLATCSLPSCSRLFALCKECDRGRWYCSGECALSARRARQREASRLYQSTERGRRAHAERQARYRRRQRGVTHRSTHETSEPAQGAPPTPGPLSLSRACAATPSTARRSAPPRSPGAASPPRMAHKPPCCHYCGHTSGWLRSGSLATTRTGRRARPRRGRAPPSGAVRTRFRASPPESRGS